MNLTNLKASARKACSVLASGTTKGLAAFGLLAFVVVVFDGGKLVHRPDSQASVTSFDKLVESSAVKADVVSLAETDPRHRPLATYLSRKYRVASDALEEFVGEAYATGHKVGVDPLLILAVMAIESRFNPVAESVFGAKGLMQVVPRFHMDKLANHGGEDSLLTPRTNILVGTQILKDYIRRTGSLEAGLQLYGGATDDPTAGYAQKVIAEQQRLQQTLQQTLKRPVSRTDA